MAILRQCFLNSCRFHWSCVGFSHRISILFFICTSFFAQRAHHMYAYFCECLIVHAFHIQETCSTSSWSHWKSNLLGHLQVCYCIQVDEIKNLSTNFVRSFYSNTDDDWNHHTQYTFHIATAIHSVFWLANRNVFIFGKWMYLFASVCIYVSLFYLSIYCCVI